MRERLVSSFVLLAVIVLVMVVSVQAWTVEGMVRDQEQSHQDDRAALIANVLTDRIDAGGTVNGRC